MEENKKIQGNKTLPIIIGVVLVAAFFVFNGFFGKSALEKRAERMFEKETGGTADIDFNGESRFEIKTENGSMVIDQQGGLPEDYPDDIEIYPNADVTAYVSMNSEDIKGFNTTLSTDALPSVVYDFYLKSLEDNGWAIISQLSAEGYGSIGAEKAERTLVATIAADNNTTVIVLTVKTD